jgi:hypothetical protein
VGRAAWGVGRGWDGMDGAMIHMPYGVDGWVDGYGWMDGWREGWVDGYE